MEIVIIRSICLNFIVIKPNGIRDFLFILFIEIRFVFKQTFLLGFYAIIWIQNFYFNYTENWKPNLVVLWQLSQTFFHLSCSSSSWRTILIIEGRLTKSVSSLACASNSKMKTHAFNWCNFQYNKIQYLHHYKNNIIICMT